MIETITHKTCQNCNLPFPIKPTQMAAKNCRRTECIVATRKKSAARYRATHPRRKRS